MSRWYGRSPSPSVQRSEDEAREAVVEMKCEGVTASIGYTSKPAEDSAQKDRKLKNDDCR